MTEQEIKKLTDCYDRAKVVAKEANALAEGLEYRLRDALEELFKQNPKYRCPECGGPMFESGYRNIRSDWTYCVKCKNCGYHDAPTFKRMDTFLTWFDICNEEKKDEK